MSAAHPTYLLANASTTDAHELAVYRRRGGYTALEGSKVVRVVSEEIRELVIAELRKRGRVTPRFDHNWSVAPDVFFAPGSFASRSN